MEVNQQSDHVTHAVLGKQESVQMGVSNSATLMHVLSTALYTHPKLAAVREITCNGWDGHIISKNTDTPLQITIDDDFVRIRDFGPGIPHDKIGEIYGTYGNSTKRHDGEQTGGFGLGSKAPFAYTDNFEVINHHDGVKVIYRISKSSLEFGGMPTIDTIVKLPTTETGIQVSMNVKSRRDAEEFKALVREVCLLGEIKAELNGEELDRLPTSESPTGYIINSADGTLLTRINLRYGNVVYPIPRLDAYGEIWDQVDSIVRGLWSGANVIFMAPPNSVSIAPSREALSFMDATVEAIKGMLASFKPQSVKTSHLTSRQVTMRQVNQIIPTERKTHPGDLAVPLQLKAERGTSKEVASGPYNYDARKAAVSYAISRRSLSVEGNKLVFARVKNAIHHGLFGDRSKGEDKMAREFLKASQKHEHHRRGRMPRDKSSGLTADSYLRAALHKHITYPLQQALKAHDFMVPGDMYFVKQRYHWEPELCNPLKYPVEECINLFGFLNPRVLLARSKRAIKEFMDAQKYKEPGRRIAGWMVYQLPKSDKDYAAIRAVFEGLGYEVHEYLPVVERAVRAKKSDDPNWVPAAKKAAPKRKGYLTLDSSRDGDYFTLTHARANCSADDHVFEPIAYTILSSGSDYSKKRFGGFSDVITCRTICDVFGKQIAVITTNQVEKLEALGVPELSKFINQHVDDTLSSAKDFPRYLAFGRHVASSYDRPEGANGILQGLTQHHDLAAKLPIKFRFCVSAETLMMAQLYNDAGLRHRGFPKCKELENKVQPSKQVKELRKQIQESPWFGYIDADRVANALHRKAPNDPALAIPYEIVTHLMTPVEEQQ